MTTQQTLFPGVEYALGPTRQMPLSGEYLTQIMDVVKRTDPSLTIRITSGGQAQLGTEGPRTGSTRHDVDHTGHAHTADFALVRDGQIIRPDDDQELYARLFQNAGAAGFQGMGHYEWGVHIGGGSQAFWGPSTGSGTANPIFKQAAEAGWAGQWANEMEQITNQAPQAMDPTATPMNPSGSTFTFSSVVEAGNGFTTIQGSDGLHYTLKGPRNWRNNNPGNIEFGDFARSQGAVGTDGRFAVFPTYQAGRDAKEALLFEGERYRGMNLTQALNVYAPPSENNTQLYIDTVARAVGINPNTPLHQLTPEQRSGMMDAMEAFEGYNAGVIERDGQQVDMDLKATFNPRNGPSGGDFAGDSQFSMAANQHSVDIGQINAPRPYTRQEQAAQEAEAASKEKAGIVDLAMTAISQEQVLGWRLRDKPQFMPDADYVFDAKEATKDIPEAYWGRFEQTTSAAQTEFIRQGIIKDMEADQKLADAGWLGVALRIGAGITDPVAWAAGAGITATTGGLGLPAFLGAKFGRAGMIAYGAGVGATATALPEAYIASQKPTYQPSDFAIAVGTGLILGGAFGAFGRLPEGHQIERLGKRIMADDVAQQEALAARNSSAGAAQASVREDLRVDASEMVRDLDDTAAPTAFGGKLRWDLSARLKQSDNKLVRALGNVLVEDGSRNRNGLTPFSVSEDATKMARVAEVRWRKAFDYNFKTYMERTGAKNRDQARHAFSKEVTAAVRSRNPMDEFSPEVAAAGAEFRALMRHWREFAANPGMLDGTTRRAVRGFDKFENNDFYVPRIFDLGAVQDAIGKYGHDTLAEMVARAMREVNDDLSEELSFKFGKAYIRKLHSLSAGELNLNQRALSGGDMDALKELLREGTDLSDLELDDLLLGLKPKNSNGESPRAKTRLWMDEMFETKLERMDGTHAQGGDTFRISDLFINDADELMTMYSRQMSGRVAMARLRIKNPKWKEGDEGSPYLIDGVTSDSEWEKVLEQVRSVGDSTGALNNSKEDLQRLQFTYNTIVGRPHWDEGSNFAHTLRMLRDYNFMRVMGQVGFAQIAEFGNIAWQTGLRATFTNMPSWRAMWRNAKNGKLDDTLAQEWEDITGLGADWLRYSDLRRLDDFDNPLAGIKSNKAWDAIDRTQQKGIRAVTALSGMAPVNTALQRITGRAIFNKFALMARKGGTLKADKRLQGLGLDDAMLNRITKQIGGKASFEGNRLKAMNFSSWDDPEALAAFEGAVFRLARTIIQENDLGNMAAWMSRPTAKTLLQFRSFMLASWSKQFMAGMNHMDFRTLAQFATTAFLGTMSYTMQTHLNAFGRADREEYLADRLSIPKLAASGLQRSSWFGVIAPAVDTIAARAGFEVFGGRTTQQASDAVLGNPTVSLGDSILNLPGVAVNAVTGEISQSDLQKIRTVFVFQNMMGITQLFNTMAGSFRQ